MMTRLLPCLASALALVLHGPVLAHGGEDHDHAPAPVAPVSGPRTALTAAPQRLADGSLFVPKAVQRQWGLRTLKAAPRELPGTVELPGKVMADANAGGLVQSTQPGRVEATPQGLPTLGQQVRKGQVLALVRPVLSGTERGNLKAQLAELDAQQAIMQRKVERYAQLEGAVPQSTIDAARLELQALRTRKAALGAGLEQPETLRSPISGTISAVRAVAGQVVDARETLFEVVDPMRLTVEALAYTPAMARDIASASARLPDGDGAPLRFLGSSRQLREQAWVLQFRVLPGALALSVGQPVTVVAATTRTHQGTAVPQAAVVRTAGGEQIAWVHTDAERFERRAVRAQPLDADRAVITTGIAAGERVVTEGASLLAQVR